MSEIEIKKIIVGNLTTGESIEFGGFKELIQDLIGTEFPASNGWISTEEKLPTEEERVLVYATGENVVISRISLYDRRKVWMDDDGNAFGFKTVKYWQPLPEEPKS